MLFRSGAVAIAVYIRYQDTITRMFESTYLFHRISYANIAQSQDLFSFFKSSDRGNVRDQYIALMFDYPWGGRKVLSTVGFYAHELWLDVFDSAGIIATVYKGNIIKNLIMDCQSYTKYRPNETTGGIFVSWRRKEELPTGA